MGSEFNVVMYASVERCDGSVVTYEKAAPQLPPGISWNKGLEYDADFWTFKVKTVRVSIDGLFAFAWMKKVVLCKCNESNILKGFKEDGWICHRVDTP